MLELDMVERLARWRAGELPPDEASALAAEVARDQALAAAVARLDALDGAVLEARRELPAAPAVDVRAAKAAADTALGPRAPPRRWPLAVAACAAAFVLGMLVRGLPVEPAVEAPAPGQPAAAAAPMVWTAGAEPKRFTVGEARVALAPFSHLVAEDASTFRLDQGSVLAEGNLRLRVSGDVVSVDGAAFVSREPSDSASHARMLMNDSNEPWKPQSVDTKRAVLVVLLLSGSAQALPAAGPVVKLEAGKVWMLAAPAPAQVPAPAPVAPAPTQVSRRPASMEVLKASLSPGARVDKPSDAIDSEALNAAVSQQSKELSRCWEAARKANERAERVTPLLTLKMVGRSVRLAEATVAEDEAPANPLFTSCVLAAFQKVRYPEPKGVEMVQIKYPIEFQARGEDGAGVMIALPTPVGSNGLTAMIDRKGTVEVRLGTSPSFGPASAKVTVVLFSELECSFCVRSNDKLDRLKTRFPNVRFVYKHKPLPNHAFARVAARALVAADEQGRFWEFLSAAIKTKASREDDLYNVALGLNLDVARFKATMASKLTEQVIDADIAEGDRIGVSGVPSWFINGAEIVGDRPESDLANAIGEAARR